MTKNEEDFLRIMAINKDVIDNICGIKGMGGNCSFCEKYFKRCHTKCPDEVYTQAEITEIVNKVLKENRHG